MEILGVGPWEVVAILVIMLVVAGPKRMISWAYQLGRYTRVLRQMFAETMAQINKEIEASGVDVRKDLADLPRIPTRYDIVNEANKVLSSADTNLQTGTTGASDTPNTSSNGAAGTDNSNGEQSQSRYDAWTPK